MERYGKRNGLINRHTLPMQRPSYAEYFVDNYCNRQSQSTQVGGAWDSFPFWENSWVLSSWHVLARPKTAKFLPFRPFSASGVCVFKQSRVTLARAGQGGGAPVLSRLPTTACRVAAHRASERQRTKLAWYNFTAYCTVIRFHVTLQSQPRIRYFLAPIASSSHVSVEKPDPQSIRPQCTPGLC
jgi:hypothetical protein